MGFTPEELQRFEELLEKNEARAGRPREYRLAEQALKESQRWPATCTHGEEYCRVCIRDEIIAAEREACALAVERSYLACTEPGVFNRHVWAQIVEEAKTAIRARRLLFGGLPAP